MLRHSEVGADRHQIQEDLETNARPASKSKAMPDDSFPRTRSAPGQQPLRMLQQGSTLHQEVLSHPAPLHWSPVSVAKKESHL